MLHLKTSLFIIFFTMYSVYSFSQDNCSISFDGVVIDNHNDKPLVGAVISLSEHKVVSDEEGRFSFVNLCEDVYNFSIHHIDCEPLFDTLLIENSITQTYYLEHHLEMLEEITILSHKKRAEQSKASVTVVEEEIRKKRGKDFGKLLQNVAGVNLLRTGATISKPVINGLHSQRIVTVNQGVRLEGQQWGLEHSPGIDPYSVGTITVIKGAGSVEYGSDAVGGVLLIEPPRLPDTYGLTIEPSLAYFTNGRNRSGSLLIEGKKPVFGIPLSFLAQASVRKAGNLHTPDYYLDNTGVEEKNFFIQTGYLADEFGLQARVSHFNTEMGILTDSHIGNESDLINIIENGKPFVDRGFGYQIQNPRQTVLHEIVEAKVYLQTNLGKIDVTISRQYNRRSEYDRYNDMPGLRLKTETNSAKAGLEHSFGSKWHGKFGIDGQLQTYKYDGFYLIPEYDYGRFGTYVRESFTLNDQIILESGIRWDSKEYRYFLPHQSFTRINELAINYESKGAQIGIVKNRYPNLFSGSFGIDYQITNKLNISGYYGRGVRQPLPNELFSDGVHHGTALWEVGNPELEVEKINNFQLNFDYYEENFEANIHTYLNYIHNYIYLRPSEELAPIVTIRGVFPVHKTVQNNATIHGLDYQLKTDIVKNYLSLKTNGSFLWGNNRQTNENLLYMPQNQLNHEIKFTPTNKLSMGAHLQTVFKQNRTPNSINDYGTIPDGYSILNLSGSFTTSILNNPLTIQLTVSNLLNKSYRNYLDRFRYFAESPGRNAGIQLYYKIQ